MSGSDQFRFQPRDGTELEGQLTVTDPLGQPAGFTSLSALEQGQNTLQHTEKPRTPPQRNTHRGHLCKPQADTDSWLGRAILEDWDILSPEDSSPTDFQGLMRH